MRNSKHILSDSRINELASVLDGSSILITGGTGSFGRAFVKRLLSVANPSRIIVFSRDELKQYEMQTHSDFAGRSNLRYFIGDVRDQSRLEMAMRDVDFVVHAAALKQVTTAEYNPFECIRTNVMGAENVAQAAIRSGIKKVVALSTDKAANPVNLYGASKLASDKIFVAANNLSGSTAVRFSVVRYGNVVGSRGSVVPLFKRLLAENTDHLPITDDRMTRFWITLSEGVDFVLSSLLLMNGGEIFVPKIPSMKMIDLARCMAPDLPQKVVGVRPGEKIHEVMVTEDDARTTIEIDDRYVILPAFKMWGRGEYDYYSGVQVAEGFRFSSDENQEWLGDEEMISILDTAN